MMNKKLFTILTLLVAVVTGAWADSETLSGSDATTKDTEIKKTSVTLLSTYNPSGSATINEKSTLKIRTKQKDANTGNTYGFALKVNDGYKITALSMQLSSNDNSKTAEFASIDVDGNALAVSNVKVNGAATTYPIIAPGKTSNPAYIEVSITGIEAKDYINFTYSDTGGKQSQMQAYITITYESVSAGPSISSFTPATGATVKSGTTVTIAGSTGSTVYYKWSASTLTASEVVSSGTAGTAGAATVTTTGITSSATTLYAVAVKDATNSTLTTATYTIDDDAPTTPTTSPTNGAEDVAVSGSITLTFNENVACTTNATLTPAGGDPINLTPSVSGAVVTFAYNGLDGETVYTFNLAANSVTDIAGNAYASAVNFSFTTLAALRSSDLAVAAGKGTINTIVGASNYTLTKGTDFTTSNSDGAITYASSAPGVAFVNATTGELQFLGAGTTTITLTQADGTSYEGGSVTFKVNVLPSACLNLGDKDEAITQLNKGWSYDTPYFDKTNKLVIISAYSAVNSSLQGFQQWIGVPKSTDKLNAEAIADPANYKNGGSSDNKQGWSASTPFLGAAGYFNDNSSNSSYARYSTMNSSRYWTVYSFRVKGISEARARVKGNNASRYVTIAAYEITDGVLAATTSLTNKTSDSSESTISTGELNSNKEYLIVLSNTTYTSNLQFFEIAFTASASDIEIPSNRITTSAAGWASYTPMYKVSGTIYKPVADEEIEIDNMTVYAVSAVGNGNATMSEVTAGMAPNNGYFLKGTPNTTYRTTATTGKPAAPAANLIKPQTETGTVKSEGNYARYALLTYDAEKYGLFHLNATGVTLPAGKAYLEVDTSAGARTFDFLNFNFDGYTTGVNNAVSKADSETGVKKFFENGRLVILRNGVKYNAAGAQVK